MTYGYLPAEVGLKLVDEPDESYRLGKLNFKTVRRVPVRVSLGCHVEGLACPVPELNDGPSTAAQSVKRVAAKMPPLNRAKLRRLKRFALRFCKRHFNNKQFASDERFDFDEWINNTPYPEYRKQELREVHEKMQGNKTKKTVKMFLKDEAYTEYKWPRGIYSRDDEYKCDVGPFFQKFNEIIFDTEFFIKKIPVNDRPKWLLERFKDRPNVKCTDFSCYEATFTREIMAVERIVYKYLLEHHPMKDEIMLKLSVLMGENIIKSKYFEMKLQAKRMSGEMNTSSANGIFNLIVTFFLLEEAGNRFYGGVFEGDDGIFWYDHAPPTSISYAELGAKIKIESPTRLEEASFCGMIFDSIALDNIADPLEAIVLFGWTTRQYLFARKNCKDQLLKSKSLSMLYQYPGCPILRNLALYGLRMTTHVNIEEVELRKKKENLDSYNREKWYRVLENYKENDVFEKEIHINTRLLVENKYKITIDQQLQVEKYLDTLTEIVPLQLDVLHGLMPRDWFNYYSSYHIETNEPKTYEDLAPLNISIDCSTKVFLNAHAYYYHKH